MFTLSWAVDAADGRVSTAREDRPARCPCCRRSLSWSNGHYHHPAGMCTPSTIRTALAWRRGLSVLSGARCGDGSWPELWDRCVCCAEPVAQITLQDGGPGGSDTMWAGAGWALRVGGGADAANAQHIWLHPRAVLESDGCWLAIPRRQCDVCAEMVEDHLRAFIVDFQARQAAQRAEQAAWQRLREVTTQWSLPLPWGPYTATVVSCGACNATVPRYCWTGDEPPPPPPPTVSQESGEWTNRCAGCGADLS